MPTVNHPPASDNPIAAPQSRIVTISDPGLTDEIIQFLATSESREPRNYALRKRRVQTHLAKYMSENGLSDKVLLEVERDGLQVLLPLRLIDMSGADRSTDRSDWFTAEQQLVDNLAGQILDMAWQSGGGGEPNRLVVLFADSVQTVHLKEGQNPKLNTQVFPPAVRRAKRTPFPAGILAARTSSRNQEPDLTALTSSLETPQVANWSSGHFQQVRSTDLVPRATHPTSWLVQGLRNLFVSRQGHPSRFRSLREFGDSRRFALLNQDGRLKLYQAGVRRELWTSDRTWGNRLFLLGDDLVAVCDSRQNTFVVFVAKDDRLALLGESPRFSGAVQAVALARYQGEDGLMVATVIHEPSHQTMSRILFIANANINWRLPVTQAESSLPDPRAELEFLLQPPASLPEFFAGTPVAVQRQIFETVVQRDPNGELQPILTSSITPAADSSAWEIEIDEAVRFSDGSPMTAENLKSSWEKNWQACHKRACTERWLWANVRGADSFASGKQTDVSGLQIINQRLLRVHLTRPNPDFPEHLAEAEFVVRKAVAGDGRGQIGTGPFVHLKKTREAKAQTFHLSRNEVYHGSYPPLAGLRLKIAVANPTDALQTNETAAAVIHKRSEVEYFRKVRNRTVQAFPSPTIYFLALNPAAGALADRALRDYLIRTAVDRQVFSQLVDEAESSATNRMLPHEGTLALEPNLNSARPASRDRALLIAYRSNDGVTRQIAELLSARLAQVGISTQVPLAVSGADFVALRGSGKYDILVDAFTPASASGRFNLLRLLSRGYALDSAAEQKVVSMRENKVPALTVEQALIGNATFFPLLKTAQYFVAPVGLQDWWLGAGDQVRLSKAWLPQ